jgi:hypothetical protein
MPSIGRHHDRLIYIAHRIFEKLGGRGMGVAAALERGFHY